MCVGRLLCGKVRDPVSWDSIFSKQMGRGINSK